MKIPQIPGLDTSKIDPKMMQQMQQGLQRLPRGQLVKLQSVMQKAMQGQDVSREAVELERMLPPEFKAFAIAIQNNWMQRGIPGMTNSEADESMDEEQAKKVLADAVKAGKISQEEASKVMEVQSAPSAAEDEKAHKKSLLAKLFKK